ncbi:unnamed protein product [Choristocarpus tenellus]
MPRETNLCEDRGRFVTDQSPLVQEGNGTKSVEMGENTSAVNPSTGTLTLNIEEATLAEDAPTPPASPARGEKAILAPTGFGKKDFFNELRQQEAKKGRLGTVHASTKPVGGTSHPVLEKSRDWDCLKCGKSNYRKASECDKCHALKRMTLWRD